MIPVTLRRDELHFDFPLDRGRLAWLLECGAGGGVTKSIMSARYTYHVSVRYTPGRTNLAQCESSPNPVRFSTPQVDGVEEQWVAEELLLCALASCFTITFHNLAREADYEYTDLEVRLESRGNRTEVGFDFSEIVVRPRLTVHSEEEFELGLSLLRRTKAQSLISRALSVAQTLEPRVECRRMPVGGWKEEAVNLGM